MRCRRAPRKAGAAEHAKPWPLKSGRIFVALVECIVDACEKCDAFAGVIVGSEVDHEIGIGIEPLDREAAVPIDLRANVQARRGKREPVSGQPGHRQARLVFRSP